MTGQELKMTTEFDQQAQKAEPTNVDRPIEQALLRREALGGLLRREAGKPGSASFEASVVK